MNHKIINMQFDQEDVALEESVFKMNEAKLVIFVFPPICVSRKQSLLSVFPSDGTFPQT